MQRKANSALRKTARLPRPASISQICSARFRIGIVPEASAASKNYSHAETKAMLAEAYANTNMDKVTFTYYPDGLPCGSQKLSQVFPGMVKTCTAESGSMMWQDIVSATDRDVWAATVDSLTADDRQVLEAARSAGNMSDIGMSMGFAGKTAERRGKRALIAANDNLMGAIDAYAA